MASWDSFSDWICSGCPNNGACGYWILGGLYLVLAVAALVQFIRIQLRLADSGWTLQKAFHLFNVIVCLCRGITLFFWHDNDLKDYRTADLILFDAPSLMFFTTYSLLALFWAEIVHSTDSSASMVPPRYTFIAVNFLVYLVFAILWVLVALGANRNDENDNKLENDARNVETWFQVALYGGLSSVFIIYGAKLFALLEKSPIASDFRQRKTIEVVMVGILCVLCFMGKAALEIVSRVKETGGDYAVKPTTGKDEDVCESVWLNLIFLGFTEVLVIGAALGLLSDLPPPAQKPASGDNYQQISDEA